MLVFFKTQFIRCRDSGEELFLFLTFLLLLLQTVSSALVWHLLRGLLKSLPSGIYWRQLSYTLTSAKCSLTIMWLNFTPLNSYLCGHRSFESLVVWVVHMHLYCKYRHKLKLVFKSASLLLHEGSRALSNYSKTLLYWNGAYIVDILDHSFHFWLVISSFLKLIL